MCGFRYSVVYTDGRHEFYALSRSEARRVAAQTGGKVRDYNKYQVSK